MICLPLPSCAHTTMLTSLTPEFITRPSHVKSERMTLRQPMRMKLEQISVKTAIQHYGNAFSNCPRVTSVNCSNDLARNFTAPWIETHGGKNEKTVIKTPETSCWDMFHIRLIDAGPGWDIRKQCGGSAPSRQAVIYPVAQIASLKWLQDPCMKIPSPDKHHQAGQMDTDLAPW